VHVTFVTAASSGTHTLAMGWQAARPCAETGAPVNGMCRYRRGAAEIPAGVSVTPDLYLASYLPKRNYMQHRCLSVPIAPKQRELKEQGSSFSRKETRGT